MKSLTAFFLAVLLTSIPAAAQTADGQFTVVFDGTTLEVNVELQGNPVFGLASSTLRFTYNQAGLSFPATPNSGTDYLYTNFNGFDAGSGSFYTSTVTNNSGEVSVNIVLGGGPGTPLPSAWTNTVTLYFDILDELETTNLQWTLKEVFKSPGGVGDQYSEGTFANLDIPLDASLPVELASFDGAVDGQNVELSWHTTSDFSGESFSVQTRTIEGAWQTLGDVAGQGKL
ncbi:MAG: hypothetical protein HKN13_00215, partial [Rhodothermales bacterium]|nr:hypothetical protein [Rhodothermales bacterium]